MLKKRVNTILFVSILTVLLVGCEQLKSPEEVTLLFWQAIKAENIDKVTAVSLEEDIEFPANLVSITNIKTGRIIIDSNEASVETILHIQEEQENKEVVLETLLIRQEGDWRVNYTETMEQLVVDDEVDALIEGLQELGEQATEVLSESIQQMTDVLPEVREEIERVEQEMKHVLPEFKEKLRDVLDSLEDALEKLPEPPSKQERSEEAENTDIQQHQI